MKSLDLMFFPAIGDIGFLRAPAGQCVEAYLAWLGPIYRALGITLKTSKTEKTFDGALRQLLPLTNIKEQRFLFMPTDGPWTAFFTNGFPEPDVSSPVAYLARTMHVEGLRIANTPDDAAEVYPGRIFEMFGPQPSPVLNTTRSIYSVFDGSSWEFEATGQVQPFEQPAQYVARKTQDRLTSKMLQSYATALGVRCFDEHFYLPEGAVLVEKVGLTPPQMKTFSTFPGLRLK